jgi:hypothetical protein
MKENQYKMVEYHQRTMSLYGENHKTD